MRTTLYTLLTLSTIFAVSAPAAGDSIFKTTKLTDNIKRALDSNPGFEAAKALLEELRRDTPLRVPRPEGTER